MNTFFSSLLKPGAKITADLLDSSQIEAANDLQAARTDDELDDDEPDERQLVVELKSAS